MGRYKVVLVWARKQDPGDDSAGAGTKGTSNVLKSWRQPTWGSEWELSDRKRELYYQSLLLS